MKQGDLEVGNSSGQGDRAGMTMVWRRGPEPEQTMVWEQGRRLGENWPVEKWRSGAVEYQDFERFVWWKWDAAGVALLWFQHTCLHLSTPTQLHTYTHIGRNRQRLEEIQSHDKSSSTKFYEQEEKKKRMKTINWDSLTSLCVCSCLLLHQCIKPVRISLIGVSVFSVFRSETKLDLTFAEKWQCSRGKRKMEGGKEDKKRLVARASKSPQEKRKKELDLPLPVFWSRGRRRRI